jgi:hypothetical protein
MHTKKAQRNISLRSFLNFFYLGAFFATIRCIPHDQKTTAKEPCFKIGMLIYQG